MYFPVLRGWGPTALCPAALSSRGTQQGQSLSLVMGPQGDL